MSVVTLSIYDNNKFLEKIKQGFKRTISCIKYKCKTNPKTHPIPTQHNKTQPNPIKHNPKTTIWTI